MLNGGIRGKINSTSLTSAQGIWRLEEVYTAKKNNVWPLNVDGLTAATAGLTAVDIKNATGTTTDGLYWIKNPNINGGVATQIYCNMSTDGGGWMLVYDMTNPTKTGSPTEFTFATDNSALFGSGYTAYSRVAYRMQNNQGNGATTYYAWASMDKWGSVNPLTIRPSSGNRAYVHQTNVTNLNVISNYNQSWVTNTTGSSGRLEIWPSNYNTSLTFGDGDNSKYDHDDSGATTSDGYGCFNIFNMTTAGFTNSPQVVMAWNNHNGLSSTGGVCVGFGRNVSGEPIPPTTGSSSAAAGEPDWTFTNTGSFNFRHQGWIR